jgi:hypothetical protein
MSDRDDLAERLDAVEDDLGDDRDQAFTVVHTHPVTERLYLDEEFTRGPIDAADLDGTVVKIGHGLVMLRERAEEEGREILGPAESTPDGRDAVRVRPEDI